MKNKIENEIKEIEKSINSLDQEIEVIKQQVDKLGIHILDKENLFLLNKIAELTKMKDLQHSRLGLLRRENVKIITSYKSWYELIFIL